MKRTSKLHFISLSIFTTWLALVSGTSNAADLVTPPLTKCHITVDNPHISKFLIRKQSIRAVKVNASSRCNKPMSQLRLTVVIYKVGLFRDYEADKQVITINGVIPENKIIKNEKTYVECLNVKRSKYYGVAFASALVNGKPVKTLHVVSGKSLFFFCGY